MAESALRVVLWRERSGRERLSVNRPQLGRDGRWEDAITWNEVQEVKSQAGLGNRWAVEVFPPDDQVIDEAAIRHLWLLDEAPPFAWAERLP